VEVARVVGGEAGVAGAITENLAYTSFSFDVTSSVESAGVNDSNSWVSSVNTKSSEKDKRVSCVIVS